MLTIQTDAKPSPWKPEEFEDGDLVFSMTELTTSEGEKRTNLRDRYLEIQNFPTENEPGRGKYFKCGQVVSIFTFSGGESGFFDAEQRNGRPFLLEPIVQNDHPIGFIWTMPGEYPCFEAQFALSEAARVELAESRMKRDSFGDFESRRSTQLTNERLARSSFGMWQNRFSRRQNLSINLTSDIESATLKVKRMPSGKLQVTPVDIVPKE